MRILDAFCRKGGAGRGYQLAGFDIVGVDIEDHADGYPGEFVQGDAVDFIRRYGKDFDAIHASPPCQANIAITAGNRKREGWEDKHVNLLPDTRSALPAGVPAILENGPSKNIRKDIVLCGEMFGLGVLRHRAFEIHGPWMPEKPKLPKHRGRVRGWRHGVFYDGPYVAVYGKGGGKATVAEAQTAMGIDWMDDIEDLNEAIPPAYTQWIGERLREFLTAKKAA